MANRKELNLEEMEQINGGLEASSAGGGLRAVKKAEQGSRVENVVKSFENAVGNMSAKSAIVDAAISEVAMTIIE